MATWRPTEDSPAELDTLFGLMADSVDGEIAGVSAAVTAAAGVRQIQTFRAVSLAALNGIAAAVDGDRGYVTTGADKGEYVRVGGAFIPPTPPTHMRLDTTNSQPRTITQVGIGRIVSATTADVTGTVTFPVAFASLPVITASYIGGRNSGAFNPAGLLDVAGQMIGKGVIPTTTGLTVKIHRTDGANLPAGWDLYYSWTAIGVPA